MNEPYFMHWYRKLERAFLNIYVALNIYVGFPDKVTKGKKIFRIHVKRACTLKVNT